MRVKLVVSALLAFLVVVFVSQNNDVVQVTFLAWSVEMSLLLMISIIFGFGIVVGWLLNSYCRFVRNRKRRVAQTPVVKEDTGSGSIDEVTIPEGERDEV